MLAVFPAAGGLGSSIVSHLLALSPTPSSSLLFISRNPDKLTAAKAKGVTLRQADYDQPETLEGVFEGAETLCLISYPSIQIEHRFEVRLACSPVVHHKLIELLEHSRTSARSKPLAGRGLSTSSTRLSHSPARPSRPSPSRR